VAAVAERHESLAAAFEAFRAEPAFRAAEQSRDWAFRRFLESGFPTTRDEEWRFTSVAPIVEAPFVRAEVAKPAAADIDRFRIAGVPAIVLVNGRVSKELSQLDALPAGATAKVTSESFGNTSTGAFADLNAAFYEDLVIVKVASHAVLETPIHVLSLVAPGAKPSIVSPRIFFAVDEGAQCSLIEEYADLGAGTTLTTAVTDVKVGPSAIVDHVKIQREAASAFHLASFKVHLERASTFASRALTFGGRIARNDIGALLYGEGAECTLNGLYVGTGDRLVDTHTTIDHAKPHCPSHEVYKGILAGRSRAVFNGKIIVRPQAQKTDAKQTNKALLLSDDAQVNTKPQLEIFADDVKCTHGAAIGQLDEEALFYLRAHGIPEHDARHMLIEAFAGEILDGIKHEAVRADARAILERSLSRVANA
jgi:Fe-S cluster assembly protein SufD